MKVNLRINLAVLSLGLATLLSGILALYAANIDVRLSYIGLLPLSGWLLITIIYVLLGDD